jgi:hypothetical protein
MMRALAVTACLFALSACGGRSAAPVAQAEGPVQAECREEARQNPASRDLARRLVIGQWSQQEGIEAQRQEAENRAYADCLRRRGVLRGGGVEQVRRPAGF